MVDKVRLDDLKKLFGINQQSLQELGSQVNQTIIGGGQESSSAIERIDPLENEVAEKLEILETSQNEVAEKLEIHETSQNQVAEDLTIAEPLGSEAVPEQVNERSEQASGWTYVPSSYEDDILPQREQQLKSIEESEPLPLKVFGLLEILLEQLGKIEKSTEQIAERISSLAEQQETATKLAAVAAKDKKTKKQLKREDRNLLDSIRGNESKDRGILGLLIDLLLAISTAFYVGVGLFGDKFNQVLENLGTVLTNWASSLVQSLWNNTVAPNLARGISEAPFSILEFFLPAQGTMVRESNLGKKTQSGLLQNTLDLLTTSPVERTRNQLTRSSNANRLTATKRDASYWALEAERLEAEAIVKEEDGKPKQAEKLRERAKKAREIRQTLTQAQETIEPLSALPTASSGTKLAQVTADSREARRRSPASQTLALQPGRTSGPSSSNMPTNVNGPAPFFSVPSLTPRSEFAQLYA